MPCGPIYDVAEVMTDPQVRQPNIAKAQRILGWEPQVEVEEGLRRTIDWYLGHPRG